MSDTVPRPPTAAEAARLRACLTSASYEDAAVCARLGISSVVAVEPLHGPYYRHQRLRDRDPQAALITLFLLQQPVPEAALQPALKARDMGLMAELGLVERHGDSLFPLVDLYPYGGDWFATDRSDRAGEGTAGGRLDAVMPLNMSSHTLAQLILPLPVDSVLDIGTGCGVHAIRAARRARRVVATDVNPRALDFAAFNAALNGVENVELRRGSLWQPVAGDTFDQIVANPAFTLSARTEYLFRDGGPRGDQMTAALLAGAAAHLREGGVAQLIGELPTVGESGFEEQVEAWVGEAPCDLLVLRFGAMEPLEYAAAYARQPFDQGREEYEAALAIRLDDFAALGARDVVLGAVLLRRRGASTHPFEAGTRRSHHPLRGYPASGVPGPGLHWTARRVLPAPDRPVDRELMELIALLDHWEADDAPRRLWDGIPCMTPGLRLTETRVWRADGWEEDAADVGIPGDPFGQDLRLSGPARDLLGLCDGTRSGSEIAAEFAVLHGLAAEEAAEAAIAFLRELAEQRLIQITEGDGGDTAARPSPQRRGRRA